MPVAVEANEVLIKVSEETEFAEVPVAPEMQLLRIISEGLGPTKETVESEEITGSPRTADHIKVGEAAQGPLSCYYSFGTYDRELQALLRNTFVTATIIAATIEFIAADNSLNDSGNGFVAAGFVAGMGIRVKDAATPGNNGVAKVVSVTPGKIVLTNAAAGGITLVDEVAGANVTVNAKMLRDGKTPKSLLLEVAFPDSQDNTHLQYRGCRMASGSLGITKKALILLGFEVMAQEEVPALATLDANPTPATTTKVCEAGSNVGSLREGGTVLANLLTSLNIEINNNLEPVDGIASQLNQDYAMGNLTISGGFTAYFRDQALKNKHKNHTESSLEARITDPAGNVTLITIPSLYFSEDAVSAGGKNTRVMEDMSFVVKEDAGRTHQIQIDCLAAA